ncbi:hypothetical protein KZZ08_21450 [Roseovarius mucosus]|uniref:hypothetical protein n=1 Tax=Roseovarius mucosus TaxID=215743 RepID=UPI001C5E2338|nr:hypothetical protein [Roseovarius mucosus]MBW4976192.1 hypothetical protein [Roseovarius mucosus]
MNNTRFQCLATNMEGLVTAGELLSWAETFIISTQDRLLRWLFERPILCWPCIPTHFSRDTAATTLARLSPESARLIQPVLAHSSAMTAERHYIHAQTIDAGRDYASLVQRLKGDRS